ASNARGQPRQPPALIGRSGGRPVDKRSECRRRILYEGPARDGQISAACLLVAGRRQRSPSPVCGSLGCASGHAPTDPGRAGLGGPSPRRPVPGAPGRRAARGTFLKDHKAARLVQRDPAHGVFISGHRKTSSPLCRAVCVVSFVHGSAPPVRFRMQSRRALAGIGASPCRPRPRCGCSFPEPRRKHARLTRRQGCRRAWPCRGRGSEHSRAACRLPA
ncbi:unnamed protein product, partial [Ixodes persulcatus]